MTSIGPIDPQRTAAPEPESENADARPAEAPSGLGAIREQAFAGFERFSQRFRPAETHTGPSLAPPSQRAQAARLGAQHGLERRTASHDPELAIPTRASYSLNGIFGEDAAEVRSLIDAAGPGGSEENFNRLTELVTATGDPNAVAAVLDRFPYIANNSQEFAVYSPLDAYLLPEEQRRKCGEYAAMGTYWLNEMGYEANAVGYGSASAGEADGDDILHRNIVYRDPDTGNYGVIDYGANMVLELPGATLLDALQAANPGALEYRLVSGSTGPRDQNAIVAIVDTTSGERLQGLLRGDEDLPTERGASIRRGDGMTLFRYTVGDALPGLHIEAAQLHSGPEAPMLQDGVSVMLRYEQERDDGSFLRGGLGYLSLNGLPGRYIGTDRGFTDASRAGLTYALEGAGTLLDLPIGAQGEDGRGFSLRSDYHAAFSGVYFFDSPELTSEAMSLDADVRAYGRYDTGSGLRFDAGLGARVNEAAMFAAMEGVLPVGQYPIDYDAFAEMDYTPDDGRVSAGLGLRHALTDTSSIDRESDLVIYGSAGYAMWEGARSSLDIGGAFEIGRGHTYLDPRDSNYERIGVTADYRNGNFRAGAGAFERQDGRREFTLEAGWDF